MFQILEDFYIRFRDKCDTMALINRWPSYSKYVKEIGTNHFKSGFNTGWPDCIENFLIFLKLLPAKGGSNKSGSILPFSLAMDKFITHFKVSLN